jgi:RNA polymerase sigma factor (sigma-70 family)
MEHDDVVREVWANQALAVLTDKQRFVLECLYGINEDGHEYTQDEISGLMGISQVSVQRLQGRALRKLRKGLSIPV